MYFIFIPLTPPLSREGRGSFRMKTILVIFFVFILGIFYLLKQNVPALKMFVNRTKLQNEKTGGEERISRREQRDGISSHLPLVMESIFMI
jgi:hypothetical protein